MKKSLIVMLIFVMAFLAVGCSHTHELTKVEGTPATCTETGIADYWTCSGCNKLYFDAAATKEIVVDYDLTAKLTLDMLPHKFEDDKDCTTDDKCKDCDAVKEAAYEKHEAKDDDGDCSTAVTCKNCSVVMVEKKEHTGGVATCTTKANCATCGKAYGSVNPDAHDYSGAHCCWSEDYTTATIAGECARCQKDMYEEVATTYANGKAVAAFTTPFVGTRYFALNNYSGKTSDEIDAAITYMLANGETDIEVIFPSLEGNSGVVYEAFYKVVTWALTGFETPNEITQAWNLYLWAQSHVPGAVESAKITALERYNWAKETFISFYLAVNP